MKSFLRWGLLVFTGIAFLGLIGYLLVVYGVIRMNYPSKIIYPVQGIDVSHHQGDIDWTEVEADGWNFVIMKSTEGGDWKDTKFEQYYEGADKAGLVIGVYHYYSFCMDPLIQAKHFISVVGDLKGKLPPAVDVEFDNNCNKKIPVQEFQKAFTIFISVLKKEYGVYPIVYCNEDFFYKYLNTSDFDSCFFWIRNVISQPEIANKKWTFWQYTAKGSVNGIKGAVDLNVYSGRRFEFEQLILD